MGRDYLDIVLQDIASQKQTTKQEISLMSRLFQEFNTRLRTKFPNYDLFTISTGKRYGDEIERLIIESFDNLEKSNDGSYDAFRKRVVGNQEIVDRIEIKSIRAVKKSNSDDDLFLVERIMSKGENKGFSTTSFQQSKPDCCDYFVLHLLYGDGERLFIVPSKMVSKKPGKNNKEFGKLPLSAQHRDHKTEGQINLGCVLKHAKIFEIDDEYVHKNRYNIDLCIATVEKRLDAKKWSLD